MTMRINSGNPVYNSGGTTITIPGTLYNSVQFRGHYTNYINSGDTILIRFECRTIPGTLY